LRHHIAEGTSERFKAIAWTNRTHGENVVEVEVSIVERAIRSREFDRAAAVLLQEIG